MEAAAIQDHKRGSHRLWETQLRNLPIIRRLHTQRVSCATNSDWATPCTGGPVISSYPDLSVGVSDAECSGQSDALYHAISSVVSTLPNVSQIVFVDDRSTDKTWEAITRLAEQDSTLIGLRLAANVGQTNALCAGFSNRHWRDHRRNG